MFDGDRGNSTAGIGAGAAVKREALSLLARHRTDGEWCGCPTELAVAAVNWAAARQGLGLGAIADPAVADQILAAAYPRSQQPVWVIAFDRARSGDSLKTDT